MSDLILRLTSQGMKELEFGQNMSNAAHAQEKRKREAIERSAKYGSNAKNILESLRCEVGRISSEFDSDSIKNCPRDVSRRVAEALLSTGA